MMSEKLIREYAHMLFLTRKYSMDEQMREAAHQRFLALKTILADWDDQHMEAFRKNIRLFEKSCALKDEDEIL